MKRIILAILLAASAVAAAPSIAATQADQSNAGAPANGSVDGRYGSPEAGSGA